ncbi:UDP-2,3-diacylglucosamine diphosphatase [Arcicella aquatica]|uniref:UDP-2,3-diacylglucosamine diphosphatase n=1 Tax=Arcicella aquatica TaxID=217141 RepID=A0ABU5QTM8_9BACT|nr:UDP-2,3-diacylglucosamine diphosphatase [Arcicella aquatica]MEA5260079.1 UDP-2,3-diacylglucosamine diphosphatase [Arcicella aquatica]
MTTINLQADKKIYFASDFHLGYPDHQTSLMRERKIIAWLNQIQKDAQMIFLMGDLFDFWFEYKNVIPKGFARFQGKLAELSDAGIEVIIFKGNHDLWIFDYFEEEMGIKVLREPTEYVVNQGSNSTSFYLVHGDGYGPGDYGYKKLKRVFESKLSQWAFGWVHPQVGMKLAMAWSASKKDEERLKRELQFRGEGEWLWSYAKEVEKQKHHDFYIFGHRHLLLDLKVGENSRYINLGEWCYDKPASNHYAIFDGINFSVKQFQG